LDSAIELPTSGGHLRRRTWPHGLALSTAAPAGERRGRRKGKREGERGDVAADRWGRAVSSMGVVMRRPAGAAARWRAERGSGPEMRLQPTTGKKGFPNKLTPILYLIQI
jgi:hypothetical protein